MGILQDIYEFGKAIFYGAADGVNKIFKWAASGIFDTFKALNNIIRGLIDWAWRGFDAVWKGIQNGITGLGTVLRQIYEWFLNGLKSIGNELNKMLRFLFEVTEDLMMKYARWQVRLQMQLEKEIAAGCG